MANDLTGLGFGSIGFLGLVVGDDGKRPKVQFHAEITEISVESSKPPDDDRMRILFVDDFDRKGMLEIVISSRFFSELAQRFLQPSPPAAP